MAATGQLLDIVVDQLRPSAEITRLVCCWMMAAAQRPDAVELDPWTSSADRAQTSSIDPVVAGSVVAGIDTAGGVVGWAAVIRQHFPYLISKRKKSQLHLIKFNVSSSRIEINKLGHDDPIRRRQGAMSFGVY